MLEHKKIQNLNDYFTALNCRKEKGVYFYRINGYSDEVNEFIKRYYEQARRAGVVIEGKIPNPNENQLSYYEEIMGMDFCMNAAFFSSSLQKWLPRMNEFQRQNTAVSIYNCFDEMRKSGKTENMLKNAYIKFMCWLYYKFERIVNLLGENDLPKILYEGDVSFYELMLLSVLSKAGCDVVLLQYKGDESYLKLDSQSALSDAFFSDKMQPFAQDYCLKTVRNAMQKEIERQRLYGTKPTVSSAVNVWLKGGEILEEIQQPTENRGADNRFFYNCFCRINGVEDRLTYANELFQFQQKLKAAKRNFVIVNEVVEKPTPEEIEQIKRSHYEKQDQMILHLAENIKYSASMELQNILRKAFVDVILDEAKKEEENLNKLTNKAVYLLCWLKRYVPKLFSNWKMPQIGCFIYFGGCKTQTEALFLRFLSQIPADVLILCPDLAKKCCLEDKLLYERNYAESLSLKQYPQDESTVKLGTAAYHAERDLDTLMYQNSGIYRNQQYKTAAIVNLQTMYEEIKLLWNEEVKYRPGFYTTEDTVTIPVIFAKVCGVKNGAESAYWDSVKALITEDTFVIKQVPYLRSADENPMKLYAAEFYKNGRLQKNKIKNHAKYPYGILREDMQQFILDKLESMIQQKLIKGIGENGTEYTVIAQILNLPKEIVRLIQKFDFTKKNPKLIYINTGETMISLEDAILTSFLNLIGFDIVFFVPTGYQSIETYFQANTMEVHQIGEYKYDMHMPDWNLISFQRMLTWRDKFFKRGK